MPDPPKTSVWKPLALLIALAPAAWAQTPAAPFGSARAFVADVQTRLHALSSVAAEQTLDLNYASEDYVQTWPVKVRVGFDEALPLGARFRIESPQMVYGSDGTGTFFYDKRANTLDTTARASPEGLIARYFSGSFYALRRGLGALAASDSATVAWGPASPAGTRTALMGVRGVALNPDGTLQQIDPTVASTYALEVDEATGLPRSLTRRFANGDFTRTTFTHVQTTPASVPERFWTHADLVNAETRPPQAGPSVPLVQIGSKAPAWTLPRHASSRRLALSDLRGRPALLVFWTAHCGYSIASVPTINAFQRAHPGLPVVWINVHDAPNIVRRFVRTNGPEGHVVQEGRGVAETYGVPGFPTAVLVDARGTVVYAGDALPAPLAAALTPLRPRP